MQGLWFRNGYFSRVLYCDYVLLNDTKNEKLCSDQYLGHSLLQ